MARKRRLTPFARFFLVMLVLVPAAFLGASLLNGEDPMQNLQRIRDLITGKEEVRQEAPARTEEPVAKPAVPPASEAPEEATQPAAGTRGDTNEGQEALLRRLGKLEQEQEALREQLEAQQARIEALEQAQGPPREN